MCSSMPTPPPVIPPPPPEAVSNLMLGSQSRTIQQRQLNVGRDTVRSSLGNKQAIGVSKGVRSAARGNARSSSKAGVTTKGRQLPSTGTRGTGNKSSTVTGKRQLPSTGSGSSRGKRSTIQK